LFLFTWAMLPVLFDSASYRVTLNDSVILHGLTWLRSLAHAESDFVRGLTGYFASTSG
jgi:hypothetical protein